MEDVIKWITHWETDSCLLRIFKILLIIVLSGMGFSAFFCYALEIYQGYATLMQYQKQWMVGDMNWWNYIDILPSIAFLLFIIGCIIFFVYALIKSFNNFLKKKDTEESDIRGILAALLKIIKKHDQDIQDMKEHMDKRDNNGL